MLKGMTSNGCYKIRDSIRSLGRAVGYKLTFISCKEDIILHIKVWRLIV